MKSEFIEVLVLHQHVTQFASFSLQPKYLHQRLMHLILSMQVFLPHKLSSLSH